MWALTTFSASKQETKEPPPSPQKNSEKELLSVCVHVFTAYTPTKLLIMYMHDVQRTSERKKKKKEIAKQKRKEEMNRSSEVH